MINEYETFKKLTDSILICASAAREMAVCRPDQSHQWEAVAMTWDVARQACFRLMGEGTVRGRH